MFTNNYINFRKAMFEGHVGKNGPSFVPTSGATENYTMYASYSYSAAAINMATLDIGRHMKYARCQTFPVQKSEEKANEDDYGVYFGSGQTEASKTDYTLEAPITSGLAITNSTTLYYEDDGNGKYSVSATYVLRNTSDAEIIIREIGMVSAVIRNYDGDFYPTLFERTVLEEPVSILPSEAKLIEYKLTFNQGENV